MKSNNLRINISFKNDSRDFILYAYQQVKKENSSYIKDLLEIKILKEMIKNKIKRKIEDPFQNINWRW